MMTCNNFLFCWTKRHLNFGQLNFLTTNHLNLSSLVNSQSVKSSVFKKVGKSSVVENSVVKSSDVFLSATRFHISNSVDFRRYNHEVDLRPYFDFPNLHPTKSWFSATITSELLQLQPKK